MRVITRFAEAHDRLKQFIPDGSETGPYTLDTIRSLMAYLGNPQDRLRVIHVAGTSGKTSTAYYIAGLLTDVGYTTGLSVSPHINEINERAQINMSGLPEAEFCSELGLFLDLVDQSGLRPSHFEVLVAFAYWLFDKRKVEYAVIEVGLGGLLDGTNVVSRADKICVITDIGMDHVEVLGDTLGKIAAQKAGIIHDHNTVFIYTQPNEVMDVVAQAAHTHDASVYIQESHGDDRLRDLPVFQQRNFQLALSVATHVAGTIANSVLEHVLHTYIPGRMEVVTYQGRTLVMDGAHNEQKIRALVTAMKQKYSDQTISLLVSFGQNKQSSVLQSLELLRELSPSIIITQFDHAQDEVRTSIGVDTLVHYARDAGFESIVTEPDQSKALDMLVQQQSDIGLIAGSFYLVENYKNTLLK
jgi:dihydrofolate synthase / folylpolyglutamate synthase